MMDDLQRIGWLMVAVALPVLPGWLLLWSCYRHALHPFVTIVVSFVLGMSALTLCAFLIMAGGWNLSLGIMLGVWGLLTVCGGGLYRACRMKTTRQALTEDTVFEATAPAQNKWLKAASVAVHTGIIALLISYVLTSLRRPVESIPEVTIWAFKAKALALTGAISREMLALPDFSYMHPGYPLGYPLFLSWCYLWMGEVDDYLIKLIPPMLGALACLLLYGLLRMQGLSRLWCALLVLLFATGQQFLSCSVQLYAEVPLLLCVVAGTWFLLRMVESTGDGRDAVLAGLLLGSAAWMKNEGALYLLAGCCATVIAADKATRKTVLLRAVQCGLAAAVFVLPWRLWTSHLSSQASDFSLTWPVLQKGLGNAGAIGWEFLNAYILIPSTISGLGILGIAVTVLFWKRVWRSPGTRILLIMVGALIAGYTLAFLFSTREIKWHLLAVYRTALPVSAILLIYSVRCLLLQNNGIVASRFGETCTRPVFTK